MAQATLHEVTMPRLSDSMEEGTVLAWMKQVGDEVTVGENLVEIETDKANMEYEADVAGTLLEILVEEGETAAVGEPIARIGDPDQSMVRVSPDEGQVAAAAGPVKGEAPAGGAAAPFSEPPLRHPRVERSNNGHRVKASPLARRMAEERGIDLAAIEGSGPGGRIVKKDLPKASVDAGVAGAPAGPASATPAAETAKGEVRAEELSKLQQTVARRMAESKATAPHFYLTAEVDMSYAVAARARLKELAAEGDVVPSFNDMVVKACGLALREFPKANGAYKDGRFELYSRVNVGVAVAAPGALVVPTVFDADRKGLREIATDTRALAAKVREQSITPPELSGATFTVSNLGMFGVRSFGAVVNAPQAGILAVGEIAERPTVRAGEIVPAHLMDVTLSCDHRVLYGAEGAEFLARVRALLEEPVSLAL